MKRSYTLNPIDAIDGRTLWNTLIRGHRSNCLESYAGFERVSTPEEVQAQGRCNFKYKEKAEIVVIATNAVTIEAETEGRLKEVEGKLVDICKQKGVELIALS